ncbi:hypothetical protein D5R40_19510 [Okeania hirsuta]|uniref:Uncharacterized protein n=1 Tax=Okeania hirsuta TaxID=1458930 RepID=A0A3N6NRA8_9CYAN|nr:hypothetical protein D4Z78_13525 [Okeania hirsuta]RQH35939.1 hypothetical protein D5R40_19510 [Okeania hirsuta]
MGKVKVIEKIEKLRNNKKLLPKSPSPSLYQFYMRLHRMMKFITEKFRYKASPFMEKKAVVSGVPGGWDGVSGAGLQERVSEPYPIDQEKKKIL